MHEIGIWFLLLSLFIPRITLFFWWVTGNLPYNTTPLVADIFASVLIPRILILVYIYGCMGMCAWFWIHLVMMLIVWVFNVMRIVASSIDNK